MIIRRSWSLPDNSCSTRCLHLRVTVPTMGVDPFFFFLGRSGKRDARGWSRRVPILCRSVDWVFRLFRRTSPLGKYMSLLLPSRSLRHGLWSLLLSLRPLSFSSRSLELILRGKCYPYEIFPSEQRYVTSGPLFIWSSRWKTLSTDWKDGVSSPGTTTIRLRCNLPQPLK